jgi:hypothetical protein
VVPSESPKILNMNCLNFSGFTFLVFFSSAGGTLKIYGEALCKDVPYKTLLLSVRDCAGAVVREMLDKYGLHKTDPTQWCLVQVTQQPGAPDTEYVLDDDECPLSILMNSPNTGELTTCVFL